MQYGNIRTNTDTKDDAGSYPWLILCQIRECVTWALLGLNCLNIQVLRKYSRDVERIYIYVKGSSIRSMPASIDDCTTPSGQASDYATENFPWYGGVAGTCNGSALAPCCLEGQQHLTSGQASPQGSGSDWTIASERP